MSRVPGVLPQSSSALAGIGLIEAARMPPAEVLGRLGSIESGLSSQEATLRLERFGPNAIRTHGARPHASIRHLTLVLRDGVRVTVDVTKLVPGDVVLLRTGDLVPADLRLLSAREL